MENLSLENFNPTMAALTTLADKYKDLTIKGPDDKEGLARVHAARMELRQNRIAVTKTGKALRDDANTFAKKVIAMEKELVAIIEPVEAKLEEIETAAEAEIERNRRRALLPERRAKCDAIELKPTDDELLAMDPEQFSAYFNEQNAAYLDRKAAALRAEEERVAAAARKVEEDRLAAERAAQEAAQAEERRKTEALAAEERKKQDAIAVEVRAKELAAQAERDRLADEKRKADADAAQAAKLAQQKRYQDFLTKHGASTDSIEAGTHKVVREADEVILYELKGRFKL